MKDEIETRHMTLDADDVGNALGLLEEVAKGLRKHRDETLGGGCPDTLTQVFMAHEDVQYELERIQNLLEAFPYNFTENESKYFYLSGSFQCHFENENHWVYLIELVAPDTSEKVFVQWTESYELEEGDVIASVCKGEMDEYIDQYGEREAA
jgi:hypothetical protein